MAHSGRMYTWLQRFSPSTASRHFSSGHLSEQSLRLSRRGSSEELAAEIEAVKRSLAAHAHLSKSPTDTDTHTKIEESPLDASPQFFSRKGSPEDLAAEIAAAKQHLALGRAEPQNGMLSPIEQRMFVITSNELELPSDEAIMSEPSATPPTSIEQLRALEEQTLRELSEAQAILAEQEVAHERVLRDVEQAEQKFAPLRATFEQKRKDREAAERRLAEVSLFTEQGLKKVKEFEQRLGEFMSAEEYAKRSRAGAESRVAEIREEIKRLTAELAGCEEAAARERLAEEHAATERAAAEQRLEKERVAAQPCLEEQKQAEEFLSEDRETEKSAAAMCEEAQAFYETICAALQKAEDERRAAEAAVMHLQAVAKNAARERVKIEKQIEEAAAAKERAEIERQLTEMRAAEEKAARERAAIEQRLLQLRATQERAAKERAAIEGGDVGASGSSSANGKLAQRRAEEVAETAEPVERPPARAEKQTPAAPELASRKSVTSKPPQISTPVPSKPSISAKIDSTTFVPPPTASEQAAAAAAAEAKADASDSPGNLAETLRRAAEEQRAAAREFQTRQGAQRTQPILGVFGRKKTEPQPAAEETEPQLSIAERIARDFGNMEEDQ